ncbi:unnamed protein product, partial [Vitis vinifera]
MVVSSSSLILTLNCETETTTSRLVFLHDPHVRLLLPLFFCLLSFYTLVINPLKSLLLFGQSGAAMDTRNNPWLKLSILFLCLTLKIHLSHGGDTISGNETLSGDQTLVSAGGNFVLGFFKPGNSSYYYIGMWYKKVSEQTIVWVANRDTPVTDNRSSQLKILDGNLVLFNESQVPVWSTNLTSNSTSLEAVLLDEGNFVLRVTGAVSNETRWQSFDHPTHTWLPGAKLGLDKHSTSHLVPEMRSNYIYNFSFYSDANQSYFTYSLYDKTIISRFIMDVSGQIKQLTWLDSSSQWNLFWSQPRTQCEVYNFCGPFGVCNDDNTDVFCECLTGFTPSSQNDWNLGDRSAGCKRNTRLQCESNSLSQQKDSRSACESACFNNCSCTAYAFDSGCSIWIDGLMNLQQLTDGDSSGNTFYLKLAASEFPNSSSDKGKVIGIAVGSAAAVLAILGLGLFIIWRRRRSVGTAKTVEGRRNSEASEDGKVKFFPTLASSVLTEGDDILILLDQRLERNADPEELTRLCRVACWCIQDEESQRPSMGQVVQILEGVLDNHPHPRARVQSHAAMLLLLHLRSRAPSHQVPFQKNEDQPRATVSKWWLLFLVYIICIFNGSLSFNNSVTGTVSPVLTSIISSTILRKIV